MPNETTAVITDLRRKNLCRITSGAITSLPAIAKVAFGDGGADEQGEPKAPMGSQTALNHEIGRYDIEKVEYPAETTARYTVTIPADELEGAAISEAALVDAEGNLCAVKNMYPKGKDADVTFTFTFDDEF